MKLLLIGGTRFLGRFAVERALGSGHEVTLFHRGRTHPELFPSCERIVGNREADLAKLGGSRTWDAVIDTCGFYPRAIDELLSALDGRIGHYTFVSSISAYAEPVPRGADENATLATLADPSAEAITGETYGGLKAACERAAEARMPGRVLSARAGLLVGPWDYTDRFTYWVRRLVEGGDVLVPDAPDQPLQVIDARDAANWLVDMAEQRTAGIFNLTGPAEPMTLFGCFDRIERALAASPRRVPVSMKFLADQNVVPWSELPFWVEGGDGFLDMRIERALAKGLAFRPLEDTVRDTWDWLRNEGAQPVLGSTLATPPPASLSRERERELLNAWKSR